MGLHHSIYEDSQPGALVIPLSVGVIYDSYVMSVIADSVEAEVFPCLLRYERVHCQCSVGLWLESAYSGYDEVIECRVVVVARSLLVALEPVACCLVQILADIRFSSHVL